MRYENHRNTLFLVEIHEKIHDFLASLGIKIAGWLIRKNDRRLSHQCPGNGGSLLLSARKLGRRMCFPPEQPDHFERAARLPATFTAMGNFVDQREFYVFDCLGPFKQIKALKYEAKVMAAQQGALITREFTHINSVEPVVAQCGGIKAAKDVHASRFSRSAGTHDGNEFTLSNR